MYHLIIYTPLTNPYARFIRVIDGKIWDVAAGGLSRATSWSDSDLALTANDSIGGVPITIPSGLPAGEYDMLIYDAATPADTDMVQIGKRINWTGTALLGLPQEL